MDAAAPDKSKRLILCLVADWEAIDRFPTALRYLQIGLIDEPIDTILVVPERGRTAGLQGGPATVIPHQEMPWPLGRWERAGVARCVRQKIATLPRNAPVVVHALTVSGAALAAEIANQTNGDMLVTVCSPADLGDAGALRSCEEAAVIIAPTQAIQRAIKSSPLARKSVQHVRVGVVAAFSPAAFNDPQRSPSIVFAGCLSADCGVELFLRAAKLVLSRHPNLLVFVVGKGSAEGSLRRLADSLEMNPAVTFTGRLDQWRLALESADIFCLPAGTPGFREEPVHAMAAGLALVAPTDPLFDGLAEGETALLFPPDDQVAMAGQISRLLEDHGLARRLAASGQAYARSQHSVSCFVSEHVRIYQELASRRTSLPVPTG